MTASIYFYSTLYCITKFTISHCFVELFNNKEIMKYYSLLQLSNEQVEFCYG